MQSNEPILSKCLGAFENIYACVALPPEKAMATLSSIFAWEKSHGQRNLAGLQSMGSQKSQTQLSN